MLISVAKQKSAKNKPKTKEFSIKTSPKTSNPQNLKKCVIPPKTSQNSRENRKVG